MSNPAVAVIRSAAAGLRSGESRSIDCPICLGGRNKDKRTMGLGVMASGGVWYVCRRIKCGRKGWIDGPPPAARPVESTFVPRVFSDEIEELPDDVRDKIAALYGISAEAISANVGWNSTSERTVWKIVGPAGVIRGYELRHHVGITCAYRSKPLHYRHSPNPWIGYYRDESTEWGRGSSPLIWDASKREDDLLVVEDSVSALKVSKYFWAASIMGTNLSIDKAIELSKLSDRVIIALDRDATNKTREVIARYGFVLAGARMLPLRKDMKYWSYEEIKSLKHGEL